MIRRAIPLRVAFYLVTAAFLTHSPLLFGDTINGTGWKGTVNNGSANTGNWSAANWDNTAPSTGGSGDRNLFFGQGYKAAGGTNFIANNDLVGWSGYRITFQDSNAAGNGTDGSAANDTAFTITGNAFTLFDFGTNNFPRIENDSFVLQTFTLGGTLTLDGTNGGQKAEIDPVNGNITINNAVDLSGTTQLQIFGANTLTFNGAIGSSGNSGNNSVAILGAATVNYNAANTYGGDTFVNTGKLVFGSGGSTNSATFLRLGDTSGANNAEIDLNGATVASSLNVRNGSSGTKTLAATNTTGTSTLSGNIFLDAGLTANAAGGGTLVLSGSTLDLKAQTLTLGGAGNINITGVLQNSTGAGGVTSNSTGTVTFGNAMTFSGDTIVNNGTLAYAAGGSSNNSTIRLGGTTPFFGDATIALTPAAGGLTLTNTINPRSGNSGVLRFSSQNTSGTNTYGGHIGLDHSLTITQTGGGELDITQAHTDGVTAQTGFDLKGFIATFTPASTGTIVVSGDIYNSTSSGLVIMNGAGALTLSGNNSYGGGTDVLSGTLNLGSDTAAGTGAIALSNSTTMVATNGSRTLSNDVQLGGNVTIGGTNAMTLNGQMILAGGNRTLTVNNSTTTQAGNVFLSNVSGTGNTLTVNGSGSFIIGGVIANYTGGSGTAGNVTLNSTTNGTLTLKGANTYSGTTTVTSGQLLLGINSTMSGGVITSGPVGTGTLVLAPGSTLMSDSTTGRVVNNNVSASGNITLGDSTNTGSLTISSLTTVPTTFALTDDTNITTASNVNLSEAITGNFVLTKSGSANLALGRADSYNGTIVNLGRLALNGAATLGVTTGSLTINGGFVDLQGTTQTVGALIGSGGTLENLTVPSASITVGNGDGSGSYSGVIINGSSGPLSFTKTGSGTQTLAGTTNTYTGGTTINAGTLLANNSGGSATGSGAVTVNSGGTLGGTGAINAGSNNVTINGNGTITGATNGTVGALTLTAANVIFSGTSGNLATYAVDLSGATSDKLAITGVLDLSTAFDQITFNGTPDGTTTYVLATYSSETGTFDTLPTLPGGYSLIYNGTELDLAPIPEPATWATGVLVLGALLLSQRRRLSRALARCS